MDPVKEKDIEDEYLSSLMDLNVNSKPLINMLTMLAEDNLENAPVIVRAVEKHLAKVAPDVKLPILYLIDSIVKNVGDKYKQLFAHNIVNIFCGVFEKVNEKVREKMFNLRQTWNEVFPQTKLYALDVKVNVMDNNWPITAKIVPKSVHVNPNFLKTPGQQINIEAKAKEDILKAKERELLELKQKKIELELMVTKKKIEESEREIRGQIPPIPAALTAPPSSIIPNVVIPPGRTRIAPPNASLISAARSRDPRLMRMRQPETAPSSSVTQPPPVVITSSIARSMPRIPKISHSNNNHKSSSDRDRDPRSRRNKDKEELTSKSSKSSPSSRDKSKSSSSSSKSSSSDRKKSGSSDDSSPRKKSEEEKKSSKSSSHRSRHSSKTVEAQDVDLRIPMKPDSTTNSKDKLLSDLLIVENMKSSHELITSDENEEAIAGADTMGDVDLRIIEGAKKRSMSNEPLESEPLTKKNRADVDGSFGDVDLRTQSDAALAKKPKIKEKPDFEAVRAKLNAAKPDKLRSGIKILDEFPQAPPSENGTLDIMKKALSKKDKSKEIVQEKEQAPRSDSPVEVVAVEVPAGPPPLKQSRFAPIEKEDKIDDVADLGNLTAADLRKSSEVPASIRMDKQKRKGSKWNPPNQQQSWPLNTNIRPPPIMPVLPLPQNMMPQHFINPWEQNPMVMAMQAQLQRPLVVPQSTSHPILNNKMRTLRLDGTKDHLLRFYNETAIIFNDIGEPHDIKFSAGQSRVVIDDQFVADLNFNDDYKPIFIDGQLHQIKFGSPTRELYIDHNFYECYFNNQPTQILLNDKLRHVRIEGNAPEVKIGRKRNDLVLGLINIVIDAEVVIPVFLDTTVQYFEFKGKILTLQFADFFLSVLINNDAFKIEFGGLPKNYMLNGQKHFIRFTGLPDSVQPGRVNLRGMRRTNLLRNCKSPPIIEPIIDPENLDINKLVENTMRNDVMPPMMPMTNQLPMTSQMPPNMIPGIGNEPQPPPAINLPNLDINNLLKQLVEKGIIGGSSGEPSKPEVKEKSPERIEEVHKPSMKPEEKRSLIVPVSLLRPETIKMRQQAIVDTLYSGIQCSSCGLRFPPEQTMKYSQHLDWHFRQNRRERDSKRRAHFRKWYYNQSDWIKYEEIEDLEEREKNFFETQQMDLLQMEQGEDSNAARMNAENSAPVSCPAGPDDVNRACDMCHDQFDTFFNNETEEWHLKNALKIDDKFYHPICYEDYKASLTLDESELNDTTVKPNEEDDDIEMKDEVVIKQEVPEVLKPESSAADDDDDVIVLPTEEPVVTEILDESEVIKSDLNATDDDVMIQEPKIETQLVPDDDDDDYQPASTSNELPLIVKIKEEPKDDGYEDVGNDEDPFVEVTAIANDEFIDDCFTNSPKAPFQPAQDENALFDDSSLLMMPSPQNIDEHSRDIDDENNSRPDSLGPTTGAPKKPKIVLSSLAQSSLSNKNLNTNVIEQNENSILDSVNKLDSNSVDLQSEATKDQHSTNEVQEEPEVEYQVKPSLQGVKFEKIKMPVKRGLENSGLCSIM